MLNIYALADAAEVVDYGGAFSAERLALAGQMTLIGMGMIFAVLAILWGVLAIFKLIFAREPKKNKQEAAPMAEAPAEAVAEPVATDGGELIAVITAAVAAYRAAEEGTADAGSFRVVSFRKTNGGRAWNSKH